MKIRIGNPYYLYGLIMVGLFVLVYYRTFLWMYGRFVSADSYYSHGFIIPLVGISDMAKERAFRKLQIGYSKYGLILIIASLVIHLLSTIFYIFSSSGFSILLLIFGISLFIFGKEVTKAVFFPLLFLIFMFPLPESFIGLLAEPIENECRQNCHFFCRSGWDFSFPRGFLYKHHKGRTTGRKPM